MTVEQIGEAIPETLSRSALFGGLGRAAVEEVASRLSKRPISPGDVLAEEGKYGDEMYIVHQGTFEVSMRMEDEEAVVANLGPGAIIGEMSVLSGLPRFATVRADSEGEVWVLSRGDFRDLLRTYPELGVTVAHIMAERLTDNERLRLAHELVNVHDFSHAKKDVVTIGRADSNDIVVDDPQASRLHAVIQRIADGYQIVDLNSDNGTFVNGEPIETAPLKDGDRISVGATPIFFDSAALTTFSHPSGIRVDAVDLQRTARHGPSLLSDISLSIFPGEFVCIVGSSGAGKTTLLNALNGFVPATDGQVLYNEVDYYTHVDLYRSALGYVPQDDIVHPELSVYQTLYFAARLRLPEDTQRREIEERISIVLEELELTKSRDQQVQQLSGGQRKRVSIAVELLSRPGVFYLDEPTSGLDPGLDARMMALFRQLANQERTIIMTTHATRNIMMCDKVVFLARGGYLAFYGSPQEALDYFGVTDFIDIYSILDSTETPATFSQKFKESSYYDCYVHQRLGAAIIDATRTDHTEHKKRGASFAPRTALRQWLWLSLRYFSVLRRDKLLLGLMLLQAPVIAVALIATFSHSIFAFAPQAGGDARGAIVLLFNLSVSSIWLGSNSAASAITQEQHIYARERHINLKVFPYLLSKLVILGMFSLVQSFLLLGIVAAFVSIPGGFHTLVALYFGMVLTNLVGVALGLLISSLTENTLQATAVVIVLIIPQLILAGSSVPLSQVSALGRILSLFMVSRWGLSLFGYDTGINARLDAQIPSGGVNHFAGQFAIDPYGYALVLAGACLAFLAAASFVLAREGAR